jgi:PPK2 family polyphosphate:nucleotide phosphotransferase
MTRKYKVQPGRTFRLSEVDPGDKGAFRKKEDVEAELEKDREKLARLQELLYAERKHSLLVILQAMDAGGKDGTIKHVMGGVNPQGCSVTSFKAPTDEELAHDFLWRIHKAVPARGMIGIFNRSHYEDVLIVRVHELVPKAVWERRYDQINEFEALLAGTGTVLLKFFLHISKEEQKERLEERLKDPGKHWKFNPEDIKERERWDAYMQAYEDAVNRCSTDQAPWHVIPSNHKWYRNLLVARIILETLEGLNMRFPEGAPDLNKIRIPD